MTFVRLLEIGANLAQLVSSPWLFILLVAVWGIWTLAQNKGTAVTVAASPMFGRQEGLVLHLPKWLSRRAVLYPLLIFSAALYGFDIANQYGFKDWLIFRMPLKEIYGQTFINQRVVLDGYAYRACTFRHVTFVYNGGPGEFTHNTVDPADLGFASDNEGINGWIKIMNDFGLLKYPTHDPKNLKIVPPDAFTSPPPK